MTSFLTKSTSPTSQRGRRILRSHPQETSSPITPALQGLPRRGKKGVFCEGKESHDAPSPMPERASLSEKGDATALAWEGICHREMTTPNGGGGSRKRPARVETCTCFWTGTKRTAKRNRFIDWEGHFRISPIRPAEQIPSIDEGKRGRCPQGERPHFALCSPLSARTKPSLLAGKTRAHPNKRKIGELQLLEEGGRALPRFLCRHGTTAQDGRIVLQPYYLKKNCRLRLLSKLPQRKRQKGQLPSSPKEKRHPSNL